MRAALVLINIVAVSVHWHLEPLLRFEARELLYRLVVKVGPRERLELCPALCLTRGEGVTVHLAQVARPPSMARRRRRTSVGPALSLAA